MSKAKNENNRLGRWLAEPVNPVVKWPVRRWQGQEAREDLDPVVQEEPFEIRLNGRSLAVIMRTPGATAEHDRELAMGFLLSEGVLIEPGEALAIRRARDAEGLPEENVLDIKVSEEVEARRKSQRSDDDTQPGEERFERRFTVASSCGLCGKNSIVEACRRLPPLSPESQDLTVPASVIYELPATLRQAQAVFEQTGGLHAAGLFNQDGELLLLREDVGRHNAVDKLVGRRALDGQYPLNDSLLLVSGRTSFEIVQKALAARIPIIAAVSAPSSLALDLAQEGGITLIGFLRQQTMNVYTHPTRIV